MSKVSPTVIQKLKEQQRAILTARKKSVKQGPTRKLRKAPVKKTSRVIKKKVLVRRKQVNEITLDETRTVVIGTIRDLLSNLFGVSTEEDLQQVEFGLEINKLAKKIEEIIHAEKAEYYKKLAMLTIFLNSADPIGQYAKLYQLKVSQGVYTPEIFVNMSIQEILPEIFSNPKTDDAVKRELLSQINTAINTKKAALERNIPREVEYLKDPSKKRLLAPREPQLPSINKASVVESSKDICYNSSADIKAVNIIICKEDGKFFCLDVQKLIQELATKGTASNYITSKPLKDDIKSNLLIRYNKEITRIKNGETVDIGQWSGIDTAYLEKTQEVLKRLQDSMEINSYIKNNLPQETIEKLESASKETQKDLVAQNLTSVQKKLQDITHAADEDPFERYYKQLVAKVEKPTKELKAERELVIAEVLNRKDVADTPLTAKIFRKFLYRLYPLRNEIIADLCVLNDKLKCKQAEFDKLTEKGQSVPDELNTELKGLTQAIRSKRDRLAPITKLLDQLEGEMHTFQGVLKRLNEELDIRSKTINSIACAIGMNMIIPNDLLVAQQEKKNLEDYVEQVKKEIVFVEAVEKQGGFKKNPPLPSRKAAGCEQLRGGAVRCEQPISAMKSEDSGRQIEKLFSTETQESPEVAEEAPTESPKKKKGRRKAKK